MFPQLLALILTMAFSAPKLGVEGSGVMETLMWDCEFIACLSLSRDNPEGASVCLWCVIQTRRVKCEACLSRWIENSMGVWMCWSTMLMLGVQVLFEPWSQLHTPELLLWPLSPYPHSLSLPWSSPSYLPPLRPFNSSLSVETQS